MTKLKPLGRIFFGFGIAGIGVLHFFYSGIRPIIIPGLSGTSSILNIFGPLVGIVLIAAGVIISIGKKYTTLSLFMGIVFLILFAFVHLPAFLNSGFPFWVNLNKVLALAGGFLLISRLDTSKPESKFLTLLSKVAIIGKYLFAMMLFLFGIGHLMSTAAISGLVPKFIPFPQFWTFIGGIALVGGAISVVTNIWTKKITILLAVVLFIWLISLHVYYAVLYPDWQEGENFIGAFTCLCFCGTALLISQQAKTKNT